MSDEKNIITLTPERMKHLQEKKSLFKDHNKNLQHMRTNQIFKSLNQSTRIRSMLFKKILGWIELMEARLFDPVKMDDMSNAQLMDLFKYVGEFAVKLFAQVGDLETILKSYTDTAVNGVSKLSEPNGSPMQDEAMKIRKVIAEEFMKSLKTSANEVIEEAEIASASEEEEDEIADLEDITLPLD